MDITLLLALLGSIGVLLVMILILRINAFVSLLVASITLGLLSGMSGQSIIDNITKGMGGTLGFVAIVVGLGSILGSILEYSGGTKILSEYMISKFGDKYTSIALSISGMIIGIPIFFDVAFIILAPIIYALQVKTGRSLLYYALPLLASLAIAHAFIPPTPGPIAVADILGADLGLVVLCGLGVGIPTTVLAGMWFGNFISSKIMITAPEDSFQIHNQQLRFKPSVWLVLTIILLPLMLIVANTLLKGLYPDDITTPIWAQVFIFLGYPFIALLTSTFVAMYFLAIRYGVSTSELQHLTTKALGPAGIIILITGAGGVFKQMLVETGAGVMMAEWMLKLDFSPLILAFILALIVRVLQGSATVAMITAGGMMAPIIQNIDLSSVQVALMVTSIAAGATGFSHVNDSGFWLVNRYLGMTEKQTIQSYTSLTGVIAIVSITIIWAVNAVFL
jgi:Gnt-I system low-affinity gluconate transporter